MRPRRDRQPGTAPGPSRAPAERLHAARLARGQPAHGGEAQGLVVASCSIVSWQQPQSLPAPVSAAISSRLPAPRSTAAVMAESLTRRQTQTITVHLLRCLAGPRVHGLHVDLTRDLGIEGDGGLAHLDDVRGGALVEPDRAAR